MVELKTRVALADALGGGGPAAVAIADELNACLRCLDHLKLEPSEVALQLANLYVIAEHVLALEPEEPHLRSLMGDIDARRERIGTVADDGHRIDVMLELNRLDLIAADDPVAAIRSARELLERTDLPTDFRLAAQALLVEAHAWARNWTEAAQAQAIVAPMMLTHRAGARHVLSYIGNGCSAALATAIEAARSPHPSNSGLEALHYLRSGLQALAPVLEREPAPAHDRARYLAMKAGLAMACGDVREAQDALDQVSVDDLRLGPVRQIDVYGPLLEDVRRWMADRSP